MAKGRKTGGRKPGSLNKVTASVKAVLHEVFERRGGVEAMLNWSDTEPTAFYALYGRMIPTEVAGMIKGGLTIRVVKE